MNLYHLVHHKYPSSSVVGALEQCIKMDLIPFSKGAHIFSLSHAHDMTYAEYITFFLCEIAQDKADK